MFPFFENLVDPYMAYPRTDAPPRKMWPFLRDHVQPFRKVYVATGAFSITNGVLDVGLIWYLGRLIDQMAGTTS